jgi:mono/diheme cytochrome c family protein
MPGRDSHGHEEGRRGGWTPNRSPSLLISLFILSLLAGCRLRQSSNAGDGGGGGGVELPPPDADPDSGVGRGYAAVVARNCAQCHQSSDPADGVLSGQTSPVAGTQDYGSNLTPDPDTGLDGWTSDQIVAAIRTGIDNDGGTLCPSMTRYPDVADDEGSDIASYLASLVPVRRPIPASGCSR